MCNPGKIHVVLHYFIAYKSINNTNYNIDSSKMLDVLGQDRAKALHMTKIIANSSMYRRDNDFNWIHPTR